MFFSCFAFSFFLSQEFPTCLPQATRSTPVRAANPTAWTVGSTPLDHETVAEPQRRGGMSIAWHSLAMLDFRRAFGSGAVGWGPFRSLEVQTQGSHTPRTDRPGWSSSICISLRFDAESAWALTNGARLRPTTLIAEASCNLKVALFVMPQSC